MKVSETNVTIPTLATAGNVSASSNSSTIADEVDWTLVGRGMLVSMSQVWGVNDIATSTMMNVAVLLASPLLFLTSNFGAVLGCLLGTCTNKTKNYVINLPIARPARNVYRFVARLCLLF